MDRAVGRAVAIADLSFVVSTIGLTLPFVLTDATGVALSNAGSAVVTWVASDGRQRVLTATTPASAVFTYTLSAGDWTTPRVEQGRLLVSIGTSAYWTSTFSVAVHARF